VDLTEISNQIARVAANYSYKQPPDILIQFQNAVQSLLRFIHDFLAAWHIDLQVMSDTRMASNVMQILLWIAGAICLILFIWAMWGRLNQLQHHAQLARNGQSAINEILDSAGWKEQAQSLAAQEKWREACRAVYFACLRNMDESKILEYSPSRSNYEYFYSLTRKPIIAKDFRRLANLVEAVWFGKRTATQEDFEEVNSLLSGIEKECALYIESTNLVFDLAGGAA
jgi:hypothetical protein